MRVTNRWSTMFRSLVAVALTVASLASVPAPSAADVTVASLVISPAVEPARPQVGDRVSIAFDVEALGAAGLPAYRLIGAEDLFDGELRPAPDGSTFPDRVVFELTALRPGVAEIQLHVDYEAEHCDGEHCYWAFRGQLSPVVRIEVGTDEPGEELPDLVATRVAPQVDTPYCPLVGIYFCIENRGSVAAGAFQVLLHVVGGGSTVRFLFGIEPGPGQEICFGVPSLDEGIDFIPNRPGEQLEIVVDAMHEVAESDEGNNRTVFDIPLQPAPPGGCPTPTPTPSGGLRIASDGLEFPCDGSLDIAVTATGAPGDSVTVEAISLWHGYSQGDYGTAFSWDLSEIELPVVLDTGEHLDIPVTYPTGGAFNSRLHVRAAGRAGNGSGIEATAVYRGASCGAPVPTPTPTPTPTPLPTGDLGEVLVEGVVYESVGGSSVGVPLALVTFRIPVQAPSFGQTSTDSEGRFIFALRLRDTDQFEIRVDAAGYLTKTTSYGGVDALRGIAIELQRDGDPPDETVAPPCAVDCNGDAHVDIEELVGGVAIAIGRSTLDRCAAADTNDDQRVSVAEVVAGVNNALAGCGQEEGQ